MHSEHNECEQNIGLCGGKIPSSLHLNKNLKIKGSLISVAKAFG